MNKPETSIGKYQLIAEIARGGMGIVYLAVTRGPGGFSKLLVLKELRQEFVGDSSYVEMFLEEARLAAKLSHPNIVQTYEVGQEGDLHYLVMDYLDGRPLSRILRRKSPEFTLDMHMRVLSEVLRGLEYAHELTDYDGTKIGVVHRDMTPQNVFVTFDGQVKLVDFGIAKAADSTQETRAGVLKGKPAYMPPEQVKGKADPRSDVFAVGVMLWEAVAQKRMWGNRPDVEILTELLQYQVPSLREVAPDAPEPLLQIVEKATAPHAAARYQSAREFREAIEQYLQAKGAVDVRAVAPVVAALFASERAASRLVIEQAVAGAKRGEQGPLPTLGQASHGEGTPSGGSMRQPRSTLTPSPALLSTPPPDAPKRRVGLVVGGLVLAAVAFAGGFLLTRGDASKEPPTAASVAPAQAPLAEAAKPAEAPAEAKVAEAQGASPLADAAASALMPTALMPQSAAPAAAARAGSHAPRPAPAPAPAAPAAQPAPSPAAKVPVPDKANCDPPFYFEGTKKVFKPQCL